MDIANWNLASPLVGAKGGKTSAIAVNGEAPLVNISKFYKSPLGAGSWNAEEKVRLNLDLAIDDELEEWLEKVDTHVISLLAAKSPTYFKKNLTKDEVKQQFKPSATIHVKDGTSYPSTLRTKIMVAGPRAIRCWTPEKVERHMPDDWRLCQVRPQLLIKNVWFMNMQCGVTFECQNCVIKEFSPECPF